MMSQPALLFSALGAKEVKAETAQAHPELRNPKRLAFAVSSCSSWRLKEQLHGSLKGVVGLLQQGPQLCLRLVRQQLPQRREGLELSTRKHASSG